MKNACIELLEKVFDYLPDETTKNIAIEKLINNLES